MFVCMFYWGKPERAPHRLVVDVGGTSFACLTIYATYTVFGWSVVDVGGTSVACLTIYFTNMEATVSWTSSRGVELIASNENLYFHNITRSLTRFNHVDIQVVTMRLMTCQYVHSLRLAPRCC